MTPERWQQVKQILQSALEQNPAERGAFLAQACAGDPALRREVESLILSHNQAGRSIEAIAAEAATEMLADDQTGRIVGKQIGHYLVLNSIGRGGMGEVFLAQDTSLGRKVALKLLLSELTQNEERLRRFRQEARAASALNHPNILTIHEIGQQDSVHFMATEYVEGETLRQHLTRARMTLGKTLDVAVQVASALAAAHEAGIIHRDIKPENVMVRTDSYVKVLDFGLAKLVEAKTFDTGAPTLAKVETEPGVVMGTFSYMSPEQARGLPVDARTDIWSVGVMLYEMASGRQPFEGETSSDVMSMILQKDPLPLAQHAPEVPAELERIVRKALRKDKDERYQTAKDLLIDLKSLRKQLELEAEIERSAPPAGNRATRSGQSTIATGPASSAEYIVTEIKQHKRAAVIALALVVMASVVLFLYFHRTKAQPLTEKDTILLADIDNTTGDQVFDGALKEALAIQLEQSPFLNIFPDQRVHETLKLMGRSQNEPVTKDVALEICRREGIKAMLAGSISSLGSHYVVGLEAVNAQTDDVIAREQAEAESKEQVLKTLGAAASKLREKLGESLASLQKFDIPLIQATTSSLEALRAFSLGDQQRDKGEFSEAISFYKRAVELDPDFASAYQRIGTLYDGLGQLEPSMEFCKKAFELRDRVTERERYHITSIYYMIVTKELDKSIEVLELWKVTYPRDFIPRNNLAALYVRTGQYEKAIEEAREGLRLNPNTALLYENLGSALRALGRYDEAKTILSQAHARNLDYVWMHWTLYLIAFAEGDKAEMERQLQWASGKPGEYGLLFAQSQTEAFSGHFRRAQEAVDRSVQSAQRQNAGNFVSNNYSTLTAEYAFAGICQEARTRATSGVAGARGGKPSPKTVLALALCGDAGRTQSLIDEMARQEPTDTDINSIWIPLIRAVVELGRRNPAPAIQLLQKPRPYEMGDDAGFAPTYFLGQSYLSQGSATEAMTEFQKIIDRRSVAPADILYPLAHVGLARAAALAGDVDKSRQAYEEFFALWNDADPDIPILIQAKKEYERLK